MGLDQVVGLDAGHHSGFTRLSVSHMLGPRIVSMAANRPVVLHLDLEHVVEIARAPLPQHVVDPHADLGGRGAPRQPGMTAVGPVVAIRRSQR